LPTVRPLDAAVRRPPSALAAAKTRWRPPAPAAGGAPAPPGRSGAPRRDDERTGERCHGWGSCRLQTGRGCRRPSPPAAPPCRRLRRGRGGCRGGL